MLNFKLFKNLLDIKENRPIKGLCLKDLWICLEQCISMKHDCSTVKVNKKEIV